MRRAPAGSTPVGEYTVRFSAERPLQVSVEAELQVAGGQLHMAGWGADLNPRGWALQVPEVRTKLESFGGVVRGGTPEAMKKMLSQQLAKWQEVVARAEIPRQ